MNIAIDMSPLKSGNYLQHRVRGTGFYLKNLRKSLEKYYPENIYVYFNKKDGLRDKVDVVHYPYFEPFFLTLPIFSRNKKIVTVHDLTPLVFPDHFKAGLKGKLKWEIQKRSLKRADGIITDSMSSKKDIVKFTGISENIISVVYLAAASEFKRINDKGLPAGKAGLVIKDIRKKYGLPEKFVLYVGDATWNKNLPRLIHAASKINVPLVMVGKALIDEKFDRQNPWNKDLAEVQKLAGENKNVFRLGFVPSEDLISLYNVATVFVMPSIYEGFGLPILEAMSCGCPVVASAGGSLSEIVGKAGKYIDPYNIDNIAQGISEVFNNSSLREDLSNKGVSQSKKFTWRKTADGTMDVYKRVIFSK